MPIFTRAHAVRLSPEVSLFKRECESQYAPTRPRVVSSSSRSRSTTSPILRSPGQIMDRAATKSKDCQLAAATASAAAAAKKKPTTLLDAFEVECIRRELERLVLKQQMNQQAAVDGKGGEKAPALGSAHRHSGSGGGGNKSATTKKSSARKVKVSPFTAPAAAATAKKMKGGGVRLLGRHAVAICSGTVPVSTGGGGAVVSGGGRRRGGYREVDKV